MLKIILGFLIACILVVVFSSLAVIEPNQIVAEERNIDRFVNVGDFILPSDICVTSDGTPYTMQYAYNYPIITMSYITVSGRIAIAVYDFTEEIVIPHKIGYVGRILNFVCMKLQAPSTR